MVDVPRISGDLLVLLVVAVWLFLVVIVFIDARERGMYAPGWAALVFFTSVVGFLIYALARIGRHHQGAQR